MALDEACMEAVASSKAKPTIRFYRWKPSAVSIGYFQALEQEVHLEKCRERSVDVIRRRTGGGAVYHDFNGEITYSIVGPENLFASAIGESYVQICQGLIDGLSLLGLNAQFAPVNDVTVNGFKISGNAQTRRNGVLLQHGTVLFDVDADTMFELLQVSKEKARDKFIQSVYKRVTSIRHERDVSFEQAYSAIKAGFTHGKDTSPGSWSETELSRAQELAREKYTQNEWTRMR
jgi:lipoate-protein ligase A